MKLTPICTLLVVVCASCAPVYVPQARNVPMLSQRGEFNGSISAGTSGFNLQTAYALGNHVGVMANFMTANSEHGNSTSTRRHKSGDIGVGYFLRKGVAFEIYGGVGMGKGTGSDSTDFLGLGPVPRKMSGEYNRYFIQPSIGLYKHGFEGAFTLRFSALDFKDLHYRLDGEQHQISQRTRYMFEPALTTKFYPYDQRFYISTQFGICALMNEESQTEMGNSTEIEFEPLQFSLGVGVKLGRK